MSEDPILLEAEHVAKRYGSPESGAPAVLEDVNLSVREGEAVSVVGVSGTGKSTLLNVLGALDRPTGGSVRLDGRDLSELDETELAHLRNRAIGFVFQLHHLLPQCTALENVLVPTLAGGGGASEDTRGRARELLDRVGLGDHLDHRPGRLSGGQRQRVAVARALVNRPRLVLADEPTGSLDQQTADRLADLLVELNRDEGVAMVVVTHATDLASRMGRVLRLESGRLAPLES
jgi:predicted ABC-type transport system involved in lysophospholipase L1 biosynthesis ATPase subunit